MARTQRDRMVISLLEDGWSRDHLHRSSKYWAFERGSKGRLFLGPSGSLRYSETGASSKSRPVSERIKQELANRKKIREDQTAANFAESLETFKNS